jgi:hypothetical protein
MVHPIEFGASFIADLAVAPAQRLERVRIPKGTRVPVSLRPYIVETDGGPVEVADLRFEDGTVALAVPFEHFRFLD